MHSEGSNEFSQLRRVVSDRKVAFDLNANTIHTALNSLASQPKRMSTGELYIGNPQTARETQPKGEGGQRRSLMKRTSSEGDIASLDTSSSITTQLELDLKRLKGYAGSADDRTFIFSSSGETFKENPVLLKLAKQLRNAKAASEEEEDGLGAEMESKVATESELSQLKSMMARERKAIEVLEQLQQSLEKGKFRSVQRELESQLAHARSDCQEKAKESSNLRREKEALQQENASLKAELDDKVRSREEMLRTLEADKEKTEVSLRKENGSLLERLRSLEEEHRVMRERHYREQLSKDQESATLRSKLETELESLKAEKSVMKMDLEMMETKLENEAKGRREAEHELAEVGSTLEAERKASKQLKDNEFYLKEELVEAGENLKFEIAARKKAESLKEALAAEKKRLEGELSEFMALAKREKQEAREEQQRLKQQIAEITSKYDREASLRREEEKSLEGAQEAKVSVEATKRRLEQEFEAFRENAAKQHKESSDLANNLREELSQVMAKQKDDAASRRQLEGEFEFYRQNAERVRAEMKQLVGSLREELSQMTAKYKGEAASKNHVESEFVRYKEASERAHKELSATVSSQRDELRDLRERHERERSREEEGFQRYKDSADKSWREMSQAVESLKQELAEVTAVYNQQLEITESLGRAKSELETEKKEVESQFAVFREDTERSASEAREEKELAIAKLKDSLGQEQARGEDLSRQLAEMESSMKITNSQNSQLRQNLSALETQLATFKQQMRGMVELLEIQRSRQAGLESLSSLFTLEPLTEHP